MSIAAFRMEARRVRWERSGAFDGTAVMSGLGDKEDAVLVSESELVDLVL